ncbi:hypothetical protein [Paenibacillus wenxiniae]|uniref:Uncharacterized protein n=1 Tax=Paenibacillus wenxiniae TaxID=1636843 RepID=A0ABW4RQF1_9BACL
MVQSTLSALFQWMMELFWIAAAPLYRIRLLEDEKRLQFIGSTGK